MIFFGHFWAVHGVQSKASGPPAVDLQLVPEAGVFADGLEVSGSFSGLKLLSKSCALLRRSFRSGA